jgi:hypothetical protein
MARSPYTFQSSLVSRRTEEIHHTMAKSIEEIPVVREFPDVFPDDLPGMPPEKDIEFKIELQPGTPPITMSPNKMTRDELVELKI